MQNTKTFNDLGLSPKLLQAVKQKGFEEPTAIQAMTIPAMLRDDTNIIAQAQTGTGKTAAFGLPLIDMISPTAKTVKPSSSSPPVSSPYRSPRKSAHSEATKASASSPSMAANPSTNNSAGSKKASTSSSAPQAESSTTSKEKPSS